MAESSQIHRLGLVQPCSSWECTGRLVGRHSGVLSQVPGTDSLLEIPGAVAGNEMNFASLCAWPWRPRISWEHCRPASSHASRLTSRVTGENDLHSLSLEFPLRNTFSVGLDSPMMPAGSPTPGCACVVCASYSRDCFLKCTMQAWRFCLEK